MRGSVLAVALAVACDRAPPAPRYVALLCDRSTSATCDEDTVRAAALAFLDPPPAPGSLFQIWITGCDLPDVTRTFEVAVPRSWGAGVAGRRRGWRQEQEQRLAALKLPALKPCSAVAVGIWKLARVLREPEGVERALWVVSDLREVSALGNFERRVPKPLVFVAAMRRAELVADLTGIDLTVCGVHANATPDAPRWTAKHAAALRAAWSAAFAAMGVPNVTLRESCPWEQPTKGPLATVAP